MKIFLNNALILFFLSMITLELNARSLSKSDNAPNAGSGVLEKSPDRKKSSVPLENYTLYIHPIQLLNRSIQAGMEFPLRRKLTISAELKLNHDNTMDGTNREIDSYTISILPSYYFKGIRQDSFYLIGGPGLGELYIENQDGIGNPMFGDHQNASFFSTRFGAGYKWHIDHSDTSVALELGHTRYTVYASDLAAKNHHPQPAGRKNNYLTLKFGVKL